jgi:hypothetical protein
MNEIFGYAAMMSLGVILGLIGAGGSILTVPILVYLFSVSPAQATGYSLLIVGSVAAVGAVAYWRRKQNNLKVALIFGAPAIVGVYVTRRYLFPAIPDPVLELAGFSLSKDMAIMVVFAAFMLAAALSMILGKRDAEQRSHQSKDKTINIPLVGSLGFGAGVLTGVVGAGGGFLILPILVLLCGLPIKIAIGTDLLIIATKSLLGFIGEAQAAEAIDYGFVAAILVLPLIGIVIGTYLNKIAPAEKLKLAFGYFVLAMGIYITIRELLSM